MSQVSAHLAIAKVAVNFSVTGWKYQTHYYYRGQLHCGSTDQILRLAARPTRRHSDRERVSNRSAELLYVELGYCWDGRPCRRATQVNSAGPSIH